MVCVFRLVGNVGLSASAESVHQSSSSSSAKRPSRRGGSRHGHLHRSSSRRNKENGSSRSNSFRSKANNGGAPGGGKGGGGSNVPNPLPGATVIGSNSAGNDGRGGQMVVQPPTGGTPGTAAVVIGPVAAGSGRVRKQRAVSFEQTSTTTAGTMTTSSSLAGTGVTVTSAGTPVTTCKGIRHSIGVTPAGGPTRGPWHEYASKSLDEKKLLSKQNNVVGGRPSPVLVLGGDPGGTTGGVVVDSVDPSTHGRRSIVSVCVNDRQLPDSDDDWPMTDHSRPTSHPPLHHFKPPRI